MTQRVLHVGAVIGGRELLSRLREGVWCCRLLADPDGEPIAVSDARLLAIARSSRQPMARVNGPST